MGIQCTLVRVWCCAISHPITSSSPALSQLLSAPHAPTPLCDYYSDPIKFETVPREAGAPRDRAYWRGERSFLFALVSTLSVPFVILLQFVGFSSPSDALHSVSLAAGLFGNLGQVLFALVLWLRRVTSFQTFTEIIQLVSSVFWHDSSLLYLKIAPEIFGFGDFR